MLQNPLKGYHLHDNSTLIYSVFLVQLWKTQKTVWATRSFRLRHKSVRAGSGCANTRPGLPVWNRTRLPLCSCSFDRARSQLIQQKLGSHQAAPRVFRPIVVRALMQICFLENPSIPALIQMPQSFSLSHKSMCLWKSSSFSTSSFLPPDSCCLHLHSAIHMKLSRIWPLPRPEVRVILKKRKKVWWPHTTWDTCWCWTDGMSS